MILGKNNKYYFARDKFFNPINFGFTLLFFLCCFFIWFLFSPGVSGAAIFDDFRVLNIISEIGTINSFDRLLRYLMMSEVSTLRRPLPMLSFLLDSPGGVVDTVHIKQTNIAIHVFNFFLVSVFTVLLISNFSEKKEITLASIVVALLVALLWAINPLQVSTVSYMVQRMAMMSSTFVLLALIVYLMVLRTSFFSGDKIKFIACFLLFGLLMLASVLSKENGILLSIFVLLIRFYWYRERSCDRLFDTSWLVFYSVIPLFLLVFYFGLNWDVYLRVYEHRNFDMIQRVFTQWRILFVYLQQILITDIDMMGLFVGERIVISESLFRPITTLLSIFGIVVLLACSFFFRKRFPLISFGIIFFFTGHLLESTFLPLEMYFEHRNYLPQIGVWMSVVGCFYALQITIKSGLMVTFVFVVLFSYSGATYLLASKWGDNLNLAISWYNEYQSPRSTLTLFAELEKSGRHEDSRRLISETGYVETSSFNLAVVAEFLDCVDDRNHIVNFERLNRLAAKSVKERSWYGAVESLLDSIDDGVACHSVSYDELERLLLTLERNEGVMANSSFRWNVYEKLGQINLILGDLDNAIAYYDKACESNCFSEVRYMQAYYLHTAGLFQKSNEYIAMGKELNKGFVDAIKYPEVAKGLNELEAVNNEYIRSKTMEEKKFQR